MRNIQGILEIVAYQIDEQGDYTLVFRQPNGYFNTMEGQSGYGMKVMLEGVLKLDARTDVWTWMRMMDNEHEDSKDAVQEAKEIMGYKNTLGDLSALDELKKKMTQDTLPEICPECGNTLRHKMSGRVCDHYPCNYYVSL